jgi:hypothetical protein
MMVLGITPSIIPPTALPCDSPNEVSLKRVPNEFADICGV